MMITQVENDGSLAKASLAEDALTTQVPRRQVGNERELQRRVTSFLWNQSVPALRWLVVEVDGDSVTLHGLVRTFYEKQLAIHCCRRVAGVVEVVDAIQVHEAE